MLSGQQKMGLMLLSLPKTADPHPKLEGTIHSAAKEIEDLGGKALPIQMDIRDEANVEAAINQASNHFGGIDVLINNASAIFLMPTTALEMKRF